VIGGSAIFSKNAGKNHSASKFRNKLFPEDPRYRKMRRGYGYGRVCAVTCYTFAHSKFIAEMCNALQLWLESRQIVTKIRPHLRTGCIIDTAFLNMHVMKVLASKCIGTIFPEI
jgi:hypothetical protein